MPWVPRDLYDVMLAALRDRRAPCVVPAPAGAVPDEAALPVPQSVTLSPTVYDACVRFAFGDPNEKSANLRLAKVLMRDGIPERDILDAIKHGAAPVTL
jgi:hypothetical protein